jgi:hypothetical protein
MYRDRVTFVKRQAGDCDSQVGGADDGWKKLHRRGVTVLPAQRPIRGLLGGTSGCTIPLSCRAPGRIHRVGATSARVRSFPQQARTGPARANAEVHASKARAGACTTEQVVSLVLWVRSHKRRRRIIFSILLSADARTYFGSVVFDSTRKAPCESVCQDSTANRLGLLSSALEERNRMKTISCER